MQSAGGKQGFLHNVSLTETKGRKSSWKSYLKAEKFKMSPDPDQSRISGSSLFLKKDKKYVFARK